MVLIGNNLGPFHYYTAILNFKQSFGSIILLLVPSIWGQGCLVYDYALFLYRRHIKLYVTVALKLIETLVRVYAPALVIATMSTYFIYLLFFA